MSEHTAPAPAGTDPQHQVLLELERQQHEEDAARQRRQLDEQAAADRAEEGQQPDPAAVELPLLDDEIDL